MLSEKEKKLVQDPYFQVLRLIEDYDEDYVELKSKCTMHCWAIRRKGDNVVLFHKHDVKHAGAFPGDFEIFLNSFFGGLIRCS